MKFSRLNIAALVCYHIVGHDHGPGHRMIAGILLMIVGVGVAQGGHVVEIHAVAYVADLFGYAFHGIGLVPFIEHGAETYSGKG